jgi:hypothetical protein
MVVAISRSPSLAGRRAERPDTPEEFLREIQPFAVDGARAVRQDPTHAVVKQ